MLALGLTLLAIAVLWRPLAVPQLVKFPADLDETTRYRGTFTVHVDPATAQPLAEPIVLPLEIDRRVRTLPGGGAHTAVLEEAVTYRTADMTQRERHRYVIDRRSMENRDDPRSWSFSPEHAIDPAGSYRVTLPLGASADGRYRIWENEPGRSFPMVRDPAHARVRRDGVTLMGFREAWRGAPVALYYRAELHKQGFALEQTFAQFAAGLAAGGVDVEGALDALGPGNAAVVAAAREAHLPLKFFRDNDGRALVEPRTGAIVDLVSSEEAIRAAPDLAPLADLRDALGRAPASPAVTALEDALRRVDGAEPTPVYSLRYEQTAASVAEATRRTKGDLRTLDLVERVVPVGLGALSAVLLVLAGLGRWWGRSGRRAQARHHGRRAGGRVARRWRLGAPPPQPRPGSASS
jgi:hypothetical protein